MSVTFSACTECKRFNYEKTKENGFSYWCEAFPNGIPLDFMFRKNPDLSKECNSGIGYVLEEE